MIGYFIGLALVVGFVNLILPFLTKPVLYGGAYLGVYMLVQQYHLAAPLFWVLLAAGPIAACVWLARTKQNADSGVFVPASSGRSLVKSFLYIGLYYVGLAGLCDMAEFSGGLFSLLNKVPILPGLIGTALLSAATIAIGRVVRSALYQSAAQQ